MPMEIGGSAGIDTANEGVDRPPLLASCSASERSTSILFATVSATMLCFKIRIKPHLFMIRTEKSVECTRTQAYVTISFIYQQ
jgi:hypothetical protein